jgi:hypothetical protein
MAKPKLDAHAEWSDEQLKLISGKSDLTKAIRYARSRREALTCYCADGRLELSNNAAENQIRRIVNGRAAANHRNHVPRGSRRIGPPCSAPPLPIRLSIAAKPLGEATITLSVLRIA